MRFVLAESRVEAYAPQLAAAERVGTVSGRELAGRRYTPLFPFFADAANAFVGAGRRLRHHRGRHRHRPHRPRLRRGRPAAGRGRGHPGGRPGRLDGALHRRGPAVPGPAGVRRQPRGDPRPQGPRPGGAPRLLRPLLSALLAVRPAPRVPGRLELVRAGHGVPGPHGRAEPADHVGPGAREGRLLRQVAGERAATGRSAATGTGDRPSRCGRATIPAYPRVDVYGSLDELERDFGVRPDDLHRPMVDELTRPNPDDPTGRSTMRRVPEMLDCWFESGSMPFAQVHYPFENAEWFEHHYPGDFIVEYIGQTRGWFYTLHVLATALFDRPSFSTCMAHGIVLGSDGQKMSKSLRNYPDPYEMFDTYGVRRHAVVPHVVGDPAGQRPHRHRAGHPRRRAPGGAPAVERLVLLLALRQRRAVRGSVPVGRRGHPRPVPPGQGARPRC